MNKNYRILHDSDLSEAQIEADVAAYLGYVTPFWSNSFKLKAVNEQLTGADKLFDRFVPIYLQFKVSHGLKPLASNFTLSSPHYPLQKIRSFRRAKNINADPTLYFRLRDKAPHSNDFQHNVLMSLHQSPKQFAFYIAPLTLQYHEYSELLKVSLIDRFLNPNPFYFRDENLFFENQRESIGLNPFLRAHVSISPHTLVDTSEHYYSYSKGGTNIAWHSGEKLKEDFRFSTKLTEIFKIINYDKEAGFSKSEYIENISRFINSHNLDFQVDFEFPDETIAKFFNYLKKEFDIKVLVLQRKS